MAQPAIRFSIANGGAVKAALRRQSLKGRLEMRLSVGYAAPYAVHVHENLEMPHNTGQAKYLEEPMRKNRRKMDEIVAASLRQKKSLELALTRAGEFLLSESQPLVPVDTGYLRDSGFVKVE